MILTVWNEEWLLLVPAFSFFFAFCADQNCSSGQLGVPRFGDTCQYRCRCASDAQCNRKDGSCAEGCAKHWMGPGCQYRDVSRRIEVATVYGRAPNETSIARVALDGNSRTCALSSVGNGRGNQSWNLVMDRQYYLYGLLITIQAEDVDRFRFFKVVSETRYILYQHPDSPGSTEMEIMFRAPTFTRNVTIELGVPDVAIRLCEVNFYAGRYLSFMKPTNQTSTYSDWISSKAVDGVFLKLNETLEESARSTCSATTDQLGGSWTVSLGNKYEITSIQIYSRPTNIEQIQGIQIVAYKVDGPSKIIDVDNISQNIIDYLPKEVGTGNLNYGNMIQILHSNYAIALALCEVVIYGECVPGLCGWECTDVCHCSTVATGSYRLTGTCPYGCRDRWTGQNGRCDTECAANMWGKTCNNTCGHCHNNTSCDVISGLCPNGCDDGWQPGLCKESCSSLTYGRNCSLACGHCLDRGQCDVFNGSCAQGCDSGWRVELCDQPCVTGRYGDQCSMSCGFCSENTTCDHVTGSCGNGCMPGYDREDCKQKCSNNMYGLGCKTKCGNCKNGADCFHTTGECLEGCESGWIGELCNTRCPNGTFGADCSTPCGHCATGPCHHVTGTCATGCVSGYQGSLCVEVTEPKSYLVMILVLLLVVVVLSIFLIGFLVYKRRALNRRQVENEEPRPTQHGTGKNCATATSNSVPALDEEEGKLLSADVEETTEYMNDKPTAVLVSDLKQFCMEITKDPNKIYKEFQGLPKGLQYEINKALSNRSKNRYKDMYPYDKNAVVLPLLEGQVGSDYINASYIDGYKESKAYIAAQGAMDSTVNDIWRMIWSHGITVVVMLTKCREEGKLKCEQYWPDSGQQVYGDLSIRLDKEDVYCDYTIRKFTVSKEGSSDTLDTTQFHFTGWPDKDVPDTVISLVQFWRLLTQGQGSNSGPWMVHCSAGIGRTGTFIALDYLYKQGKAEQLVDVLRCVQMLREQRVSMVQTKEQYLYLHKAVQEALLPCGIICDAVSFPLEYLRMTQSQSDISDSKLYEEYLDLTKEVMEPADESQYANVETFSASDNFSGSRLQENQDKTRCPNILPDDQYRPRLFFPVDGHNDYINAVKMNTHCIRDQLILTQSPLEGTVVDLARLIWQYQIHTVVMLDRAISEDDLIWPTEALDVNHIGPFSVKLTSESANENVTSKMFEFKCTKSEEKLDVCRFQLTGDLDLNNCAAMLTLLGDVENWYKTTSADRPILVQCMDGATKCGVFCVLLSALERVKTDRVVAMAETVRLARVTRKQVIPTFEQYQYCWRVVKDYLETFELYGNVV